MHASKVCVKALDVFVKHPIPETLQFVSPFGWLIILSMIAILEVIHNLLTDIYSCFSSVITADECVTSEPVPEDVGIATK